MRRRAARVSLPSEISDEAARKLVDEYLAIEGDQQSFRQA
jgi:hypothetical protein